MLEEIGFEYKVTKLDLGKGDQFKTEFKKISPFAKIPTIVDHSNNNQAVFESGAILIYLSERSGKFYDKENKLNIDKKKVEVNTENFETNINGIFAIGDICSYPGKLKLILSGIHEGALAARGCFKYAKPDEKLRFEFTTTSKAAQERLGVKK